MSTTCDRIPFLLPSSVAHENYQKKLMNEIILIKSFPDVIMVGESYPISISLKHPIQSPKKLSIFLKFENDEIIPRLENIDHDPMTFSNLPREGLTIFPNQILSFNITFHHSSGDHSRRNFMLSLSTTDSLESCVTFVAVRAALFFPSRFELPLAGYYGEMMECMIGLDPPGLLIRDLPLTWTVMSKDSNMEITSGEVCLKPRQSNVKFFIEFPDRFGVDDFNLMLKFQAKEISDILPLTVPLQMRPSCSLLSNLKRRRIPDDKEFSQLSQSYSLKGFSDIFSRLPSFSAKRGCCLVGETFKTIPLDDVEHALTSLKSPTPNNEGSELTKLREIYDLYNRQYERNLELYLEMRRISDLTEVIQRKAAKCTAPSKLDVIDILAGVFALWTILSSKEHFEESNVRSCLPRPHVVQLLAIFRLLSLDSNDENIISSLPSADSISGHLVQVGTGEGKSMLMAVLASVFALFGTEVHCVGYNQYLSRRDFHAFRPLFEHLGIASLIQYSTLTELVEKVINSQEDIRAATRNFLLSSPSSQAYCHYKPRNKILLIDEVDVFFSPEFFGRTHNPVASISGLEIRAIFQFIWEHRQSRIDLQSIQNLQEYHALRSKLIPEAIGLLEQHIDLMIQDANYFQQPAYEIVTLDDGNKKIGYQYQDSVNCSLIFGYRTAFAYLHEISRHPSLSAHLEEALSLQFSCGSYSYAEILQRAFKCILGVTGTLSSLSPAERNLLSKEYKINNYTIMPSTYGDSKLEFIKNRDVIMETNQSRYHHILLKEIEDQRTKRRPVLVYFETEKSLTNFRNSEYGQRLIDINIVTNTTADIEYFVKKATVARTVTLSTREFGRGLNFISRDVEVENRGGLHVIQTFFSGYLSEEIQIRGRTARLGNPGSYQIVLSSTDLGKFGFSTHELIQHYQSNSFYDILDARRHQIIRAIVDRTAKVTVKHTNSWKFREVMFGTKGVRQTIVDLLSSFQQSHISDLYRLFRKFPIAGSCSSPLDVADHPANKLSMSDGICIEESLFGKGKNVVAPHAEKDVTIPALGHTEYIAWTLAELDHGIKPPNLQFFCEQKRASGQEVCKIVGLILKNLESVEGFRIKSYPSVINKLLYRGKGLSDLFVTAVSSRDDLNKLIASMELVGARLMEQSQNGNDCEVLKYARLLKVTVLTSSSHENDEHVFNFPVWHEIVFKTAATAVSHEIYELERLEYSLTSEQQEILLENGFNIEDRRE